MQYASERRGRGGRNGHADTTVRVMGFVPWWWWWQCCCHVPRRTCFSVGAQQYQSMFCFGRAGGAGGGCRIIPCEHVSSFSVIFLEALGLASAT